VEDPQRKYALKKLHDPGKEIFELQGSSLFKHSRNGRCISACILVQRLKKNESVFLFENEHTTLVK
jgi:hypothetical protein